MVMVYQCVSMFHVPCDPLFAPVRYRVSVCLSVCLSCAQNSPLRPRIKHQRPSSCTSTVSGHSM